jgi:hypothetical protein
MTTLMNKAKPPRASASDGSAAPTSSAPTDPIDFYVASGPLTTYGMADPLTGVVTKGDYPAADLAKLIGSPDFMKEVASMPRPVIEVTASSTEQDLQGDIMYLSALTDMVQVDPNLSIFLNHSYQEPEDRYGKLAGAPYLKSSEGVTDVGERISVEILNPRAALSYVYTTRGAKVGVSGGFMVTEAEYIDPKTGQPVDPDDIDLWDVLMGAVTLGIKHVRKVEDSIVGIPANQRSWVENAAKGLFTRTHDPKLAPIVKALWPTQYNALLAGVADPALRQQLREIEPRQQKTASRLFWVPDGGSFMLVRGQQKRALTRSEVADLLKGAAVAGTPVVDTTPVDDEPAAPAAPAAPDATTDAAPDLTADATPDAMKSASGKSDWPLAERDRAWDNGAAHKRLVAWAGGADNTDDLDVGKFKSVHFWSPDGDATKNISEYKLAFCDVIDGKVMAIPRAIFACAGGHGVDAADIPADDKATIKGKIESYYARMRKEFDDDTITVPWADGKAATPDVTTDMTADATPDVTVSTQAPVEPVEPVVKAADAPAAGDDSDMPAASDVSVSADGTHAACKGEHVHSHKAMNSQGGDDTHKHAHTHNGDASHDHPDAHEKAAEPDMVAAPDAPTAPTVPDAQRAALLASYNGIGKLLGFTDVPADGKRADAEPDLAKCARWDDATAEAIAAGIAAVDAASDALMRVAGVPDSDDFGGPGDGDELGDPQDEPAPPPTPNYVMPASRSVTSADLLVMSSRLAKYALAFVTKEGKRHSAADMDALQTIHDSVVALTDGMCCKAEANPQPDDEQPPADPDDTPSTGAPDNSDMQAARAGMATGKAQLDALTKSYEAAVKAISDTSAVEARAVAVAAQVKTLESTIAAMNVQKDVIGADIEQYRLNLEKYTGVSLGRPTRQQVNRSFANDPNAVAMPVAAPALPAPAQAPVAVPAATLGEPLTDATRAALFAQTSVQYTEGVGNLRVWPDGVGKGQRPALSDGQRYVLNVITDGDALRASYEAGGPARIPIVNDGE